jgi:hypothetical protein
MTTDKLFFPKFAPNKIRCIQCGYFPLEIVPFTWGDRTEAIPVLMCDKCENFYSLDECNTTEQEIKKQ